MMWYDKYKGGCPHLDNSHQKITYKKEMGIGRPCCLNSFAEIFKMASRVDKNKIKIMMTTTI